MTYPPQQPGPYGSDPYGQQPQSPPYGQPQQQPPYGGQPSPPYGQPQVPQYGGQTSYQGLGYGGGQPPEPPKKRNTGMIVAIVLIALLVLGGGGVALYLLTKDDDKQTASEGNTGPSESQSPSEDEQTPSEDEQTPSDDATDEEDPTDGGDSGNTPEDVRQAYMTAYENKQFSDVVNSACAAYKSEYGTDTTELEQQLAPFEITATADGEPEVNGNTATANIDLELSKGGTTEKPSIFIKIVEEDGEWRFCGEGQA
ncbi:flagellar basal body-associated FliL family protein [Actinophytocola xanthii]|uniref:DUF4878 domain-containing protein n=1 Tax=Actinophytocola xanthii TaxID=1912961 RepID=A0A1Q8CUR3_9PSEU|nr:hypothetical protein [Actinophytocola xanthii]OLF18089.1 hypothetical protein BU204_08070 [Actinophytocola xanthii]